MPAQPNRPATAPRVVCDMASDLKAATVKQSFVLCRCEARMIEGLVFEGERACGLAMRGSCIEHEHGVVFPVGVEHREHRSLCLMCKVEVAVPGENTVKAPVERQMAHVGDDPFLPGHAIPRQSDHFGRGIYARHMHSLLYQEPRDRLAPSATEVKYATAAGQLFGERVDPDPIVPTAAPAGRVPLDCVAPI